jgi:ketosteroid isomerase-like protein
MNHEHQPLTRRQVLALAAAAATLARCSAAPPPAPDASTMSPSELAVRETLERYRVASNAGDLDGLLAYYTEDAKIDSTVAGGKVTKADYATAMRAWLARSENLEYQSEFRVVRVAFPDPARALADVQTTVRRRASFNRPAWSAERRLQYALADRGGRWMIVETTYSKK